ncbi:copper resistance protein CopC [Staphylococcus succinus]|uniref:Copper resistance protein CopC n=1 Tax=Staphylococcus succinus TaxID=61015 RepID=A0A9Q6HPK7_9STAP|nr:copper resistance protein CopC [Staphylococcus succinus]MEB8127141.1 copper resistance protein CopC/CopD [Staphylococcus succinus]PTI42318.1 copper resistance protein CopC [Staphylococcus succinus]PTI76040.1 copper resistance protein CopC [Staphylococcus succinus]PTJ21144.1 copper resistance protein CopC [Staphylococcus succinus]RIN24622.1 copper resistance protein CopC [Staphylococcus succinus]
MQFAHRFSKTTIILFIIIFSTVFLGLTQQASAHATLEKVTPTENSVVDNPPNNIELQFNEPVHAKYSSIKLFDDKGKQISEIKPDTSASTQNLSFTVPDLDSGTHHVQWHTMSADGHEISNSFDFSIGKATAGHIDTSIPLYEKADFWFGLIRFITEGSIIVFTGVFLVNQLAKRQKIMYFATNQYKQPIIWIIAMLTVMTGVMYLMTLSSDVVTDIITLQTATLSQTPFILTIIAIIILLFLFTLRNMMRVWYILVPISLLVTLSMSGHAWSQSVPLWSIMIRTMHISGIALWIGALIYLVFVIKTYRTYDVKQIRNFLLKVNITAVALIIISGVLMSIDQTNILGIWSNIQTWSALLIVKALVTLLMMLLGFYQTTRALKIRQRANKKALYLELILGLLLILVGVIMSQINIPG